MFKINYKENPDVPLAVLGFILGLIIIFLYTLSPTIHLFSIGLALVLGCAGYITLKEKSFDDIQYHSTITEKRLYDILFVVLFTVSIILWDNSVGRPFSFFLVLTLCAGFLALSVSLSNNKKDYFIQYCKIVILSLNIRYSSYMLAGFIPDVDPYLHAKMNAMLAKSGFIDVLIGKEMSFPIMHIQTAILEIVSAVSIKDASNFAIIIPLIISTTFVYLVARTLFGEKVGLLSMLLVNVSDYHIYWGFSPQTTCYGLLLYYTLMYLLFNVFYSQSKIKWISLSIFITIVLIITHAVSSFIFIITMFVLFLGSVIYSKLYYKSEIVYGGLFLISFIALFQQWFIAIYSKGGKHFFDQIISSLFYYVSGYADFLNRPEATIEIASALPPFVERFADTFGLSLYLFFAIIGCLFSISLKYRDQIKFCYILILVVLFGITFSFPLFGIRNIIPSRWFAFEYFFVSIFASFAIMQIYHLIKSSNRKKMYIIIIFCIMAFFMASNTISNFDSPLWLKSSTISRTYTSSEIQGAKTMIKYSDNIFSDARYGPSVIGIYLSNIESTDSLAYATPNKESIFSKKNNIFLWRNYMLDRPIRTFTQTQNYDRIIVEPVVLGKETFNKLEMTNRIYDNSAIIGYYIT
ncbi:hypothetical protein [uncultured Methanolobus sp.]|uniref:hypothetical protein n=1 Tax=uncultured Methanolobus sp. TaxID=218300 RepID=UPI002AAC2316|nr:hypothetical protein [uncultured Methanolobus sp.]